MSRSRFAWCLLALSGLAWLQAPVGLVAQDDLLSNDRPPAEDDGPTSLGAGSILSSDSYPAARQRRSSSSSSRRNRGRQRSWPNDWLSTNSIDDGAGVIGRVGHLGGRSIGRFYSITPVEVMPYVIDDDNMYFADFRGFGSNIGRFGGNFGLGYRRLFSDENAWAGANLFYDVDDTTKQTFQQVGLGFEAIIQRVEFRGNFYIPTTSVKTYSDTLSAGSVINQQIHFNEFLQRGRAMHGGDVELGYAQPVGRQSRVGGYVGGYQFQGSNVSGITGVKVRGEAVFDNTFTAHLLYSQDQYYGHNLMVGLEFQFPFGQYHPGSRWNRNGPSPFRYVERNYNVIVRNSSEVLLDQVAINPLTNRAYSVVAADPHSVAVGAQDGSAANPYKTVTAALGHGDIVLVRGGATVTENVTLANGQHLLADNGLQHVQLADGRWLALNTMLAASNGNPTTFTGNVGDAVTLANNTEVSGFKFTNYTGDAIYGTGVTGVNLHDLQFTQGAANSNAVHLVNSSGSVALRTIGISNTNGNGLFFDGGTPNLFLDSTINISNTGGDAIDIANLTGGIVNIAGPTITQPGGAGLRLSNVGTDVTVNSLKVSQSKSTGQAVAISGGNSTNTYNFTGVTNIDTPAGTGFSIDSSAAAININQLTSATTAGTGPLFSANNSTGTITINNLTLAMTNPVANPANPAALFAQNLSKFVVNNGTITAVNAPALNIRGSTVNVQLSGVSVNGGPYGMQLVNNQGLFSVSGGNTYGATGLIQNTTTGTILTNNTAAISLNFLDYDKNGTGIQSSSNSQVVLYGLRVSNTTNYAINSLDDAYFGVGNSLLTTSGALGGGTVLIGADRAGTYQTQFTNNAITDVNGTALQIVGQPGAAGASLQVGLDSNTFIGTHGGNNVVSVAWKGPLAVKAIHNVIETRSAGMTGIQVQATSLTDSSAIQLTGNAFAASDTADTAMSVITAGSTKTQIDNNTVIFNGTSGIGMRLALNGTSDAWLFNNEVTDNQGGATGILFDHVAAGSRVQLDGNFINLKAGDLSVHRGIIFTAVDQTVQLNTISSNTVTNTTQVFSIPANTTTGNLIINGIFVP